MNKCVRNVESDSGERGRLIAIEKEEEDLRSKGIIVIKLNLFWKFLVEEQIRVRMVRISSFSYYFEVNNRNSK